MTAKIVARVYCCKRCGHETTQQTNHTESTWSCGRWNTCPECPPFAKYPEFGGQTVWEYVKEVADNDT